jgi:hypothetical protein
MSDIIAVIRNEQSIGMSSIDRELIVVLLATEGIVIDCIISDVRNIYLIDTQIKILLNY